MVYLFQAKAIRLLLNCENMKTKVMIEIDEKPSLYFNEMILRDSLFFNEHIFNAYQKPLEVLEAIIKYDQIWIDSRFIGDSSRLLNTMLSKCLELDVKNKTVINVAPNKKDCLFNLSSDSLKKMQKLLTNNNINFVFGDSEDFYNQMTV